MRTGKFGTVFGLVRIPKTRARICQKTELDGKIRVRFFDHLGKNQTITYLCEPVSRKRGSHPP